MIDKNKTGEELTEEVQKGIEDAKSEKGHEYRKSPTEMFSALEKVEAGIAKLQAYCNDAKMKAYSKISSFTDLVNEVKSVVENDMKLFSTEYRNKIAEWLKSYDPNPTSEVFSDELRNLKFQLTDGDWANSESYEKLHFDITKALDEYNKATGELFFFSSIEKVKAEEPKEEPKFGIRDGVIFFLAENGFNRSGDNTFFKDLQGIEINVSFGDDDAQILVSGKQTYDAVVPMSQVQSELKKWLRAPTQTYSKTSTKTHDSEVQPYSRSYAKSINGPAAPVKVEGYTAMLRRMANHD